MFQYQNALLFIYILRNQLTSALASQTNVTNLAKTNNYSNNQLISRFFLRNNLFICFIYNIK